MPPRSFVHLHNHSQFSLLDGASKLEGLLAKAAEFGMQAMAITDHGNLFGAVKFFDMAVSRGIKPILGMEAYVAPADRRDKTTKAEGAQGAQKKPYYHQILLATNAKGYSNLVKLASMAYTEGFYYKPRIDKQLLAGHAEGLIATSACLGGEIPQLLVKGDGARAERVAAEMSEIMGAENYFLELQDQGLEEEKTVNEGLIEIGKRLSLPLVATNDCHFLTRDDHFAHDVLLCIQTGRTIKDPTRMRYTQEHYFKSPEEMWKVFSHLPEAVENTLRIADRCHFNLEHGGYHLPRFSVPEGEDAESYLRKVVAAGFERRMERWKELEGKGLLADPIDTYRARLEQELSVISIMGFPSYFLIVWDFIQYARENGIPVGPGRGSAAGSLVAYCLGITDVDPIQYGLLFERFLNSERVSLPDIDIDFCMKGRPRVIDYVTKKYGRENVAQIITFGTMAARAVIRDAGRGLDIPFADVDRIAKLVPAELDATIEKALASVPQLNDAYQKDESIRQLIDVAKRLEGLTRHASTHAAGVVISPKPIIEYAPLYQSDGGGERTTQYAMSEIERIGLLKMDFLGLKTLTLIQDVLDNLRKSRGIELDIERLPQDDPETLKLFCEARTSGIFQFESSGMQDILRKLKPERFEDLIALNALYRPGPIRGGLIDDFIKRRHGKMKVKYAHPILEESLKETYGVIVYQEQVMQIASRMAGYSMGEADNLRRAMGKKKKEVMASEGVKFLKGARQRKIPEKAAREVFDLMEHFAEYGFNKAHSCAYALVAYRTAYLKAHYPNEFMAALLTTERENTDNVVKYIGECREMGIELLPPDVNKSGFDFSVEDGKLRFGLSAIKNVGETAIRSILEARTRLGGFRGLVEFCESTDPRLVNKRVLESLIKSGAFDFLEVGRSRMGAGIDSVFEIAARKARDRQSGQASLFGGAAPPGPGSMPVEKDPLPEVASWTERETLAGEKETLGFYLTGHPLVPFVDELAEFCTHTTARLQECQGNDEVTVGGLITGLKRRKTRKGDWMATFHLEDLEGTVEVIVFPELYGRILGRLVEDSAVLVGGRAEVEDRARIRATSVTSLKEEREGRTTGLSISLVTTGLTEEILESLMSTLENHKGRCPLYLELACQGGVVLTLQADATQFGADPSKDLVASVESILGRGAIRYRQRKTPVA